MWNLLNIYLTKDGTFTGEIKSMIAMAAAPFK
jgi:hypothetical protein